MAFTNVQIANMALTRVGNSRFISNLTETSNEAVVINSLFTSMRELVLEKYEWPFATAYAELGLLHDREDDPSDSPLPWSYDWRFTYTYPVDCISARRLIYMSQALDRSTNAYWQGRGDIGRVVVPFSLMEDPSNGKVLVTDMEHAVLQYTARVENPSRFSASFASALAWKLAAEICLPLSANDSLRSRAEQNFVLEVTQSAANAANEEVRDPPPESEFIRARESC